MRSDVIGKFRKLISTKFKLHKWFLDYEKRVLADGGEILDIQQTNSFFSWLYNNRDPYYNNAKIVISAYAGIKLDGSRINKFYDLSPKKNNPEFTGNDRPFKIIDFDNNTGLPSSHQISVEVTATNLIPSSNTLGGVVGSITKTVQSHINPFQKIVNMAHVDYESGVSNSGVIFGLNGNEIKTNDYLIYSGYVKRLTSGGGTLRIVINTAIDVQVISEDLPEIVEVNKWYYVSRVVQYTGADTTILQFSNRINKNTVPANSKFLFWKQHISIRSTSPFPTDGIETFGTAVTRITPNPVLLNSLPIAGIIAGWVDCVNTNSHVFDTGGLAETNRTELFIQTSINRIRLRLFGTNGGSFLVDPEWNWPANTRKKIGFLCSYKHGSANLYLCEKNGSLKKYTQIISITDTSRFNLCFGHNSGNNLGSIRFESNFYTQDAPDLISDTEAIKLISRLSIYKGGPNLEPENIELS